MINIYPITPVPAPRQVQRDKWNPSPSVKRYRAFRDEVRLRKVTIPTPFYHVIFVLPMPRSWPEKKKRAQLYRSHTQVPDRDNCEKSLLDSVFGQDEFIWDGRTTKVWGERGMIIIADHNLSVEPAQIAEIISL